jgi:isopenicillin N synthase-like dioxygenase
MHAACLETGFFVAIGHGLDRQMTDVFAGARRFFDLPEREKERTPRLGRYGFVPHDDLAINPNRQSGRTEFLELGLADEVPMPAIPGFEVAVRSYQQVAVALGREVLGALAVQLGVARGWFDRYFVDPECRLRLLHYLGAGDTADEERDPVPTPPHTDYGALTLLATDGVAGLEVATGENGWVGVEAPPGALVVNIGDMLARWTNDVYASTPHRVIAPRRDRVSIPFFLNPSPDTLIEAIPTCVDAINPDRYPAVRAGDSLRARIDGSDEPYLRPS